MLGTWNFRWEWRWLPLAPVELLGISQQNCEALPAARGEKLSGPEDFLTNHPHIGTPALIQSNHHKASVQTLPPKRKGDAFSAISEPSVSGFVKNHVPSSVLQFNCSVGDTNTLAIVPTVSDQ